MYVLQKNKSGFVFYSFSSEFYFIGDKIDVDNYNDQITPSLKKNYRLKFTQGVALTCVRKKGKPPCKL